MVRGAGLKAPVGNRDAPRGQVSEADPGLSKLGRPSISDVALPLVSSCPRGFPIDCTTLEPAAFHGSWRRRACSSR